MKITCNTGVDTNQLTLEVTVGTAAIAYTSLYLKTGAQQTKIAESNEGSGNITVTAIGAAAALRNSYLIILTSIDMSNLETHLWENQCSNLSIKYRLSGGLAGSEVYQQDADDTKQMPNGKLLITKSIQLV